MGHRVEIKPQQINSAIAELQKQMKQRLNEKGSGSCTSSHEILGIVTEEYHELIQAVVANAPLDVTQELYDIAVAAVFGAACIRNRMDW